MKLNLCLFFAFIFSICSCSQKQQTYDIVIYGATSAGISAAVETARSGKTVIIVNPDNHVGGLTTGGLGSTDIGNKQVIGGFSREFYRNIKKYYDKPENWRWQNSNEYLQDRNVSGEDAMWTFEPNAAQKVFNAFINEYQIPIVNERLVLDNGVVKKNGKIVSIKMESGLYIRGKIFIDASYEGDLMAVTGVSYTLGRESNSMYSETLNGVQTKMGRYHQFPDGVDPYKEKGKPESGLLPNINENPGEEGVGDEKIQAYCFRMCLTDIPENRISIKKPELYNEQEYELLFRYIENGEPYRDFFNFSMMPNRKTDSNNGGPFSTDYIGKNYDYPNGNYKQRENIIKAHKNYQLGLCWTLANHPRIPKNIRDKYKEWGLPKDEFTDNGNWTPQLYIREARRMVSDYVMTTHHCTQDSISSEKSIGMGAYTMDSHHVQRYVNDKGYVKNEGDVEVGGFKPYPIDYRAIVPRQTECINLLVPVCLSSTHMAFGSIRMEPVFMILGQSAAVAACMAVDENINVQDIDYVKLKNLLLEKGQILTVENSVQ
ncbi:MAG TPA: xanthan lyase [Clostridiales bacterium]|nr:xanthan lyase [Clostridiales bacterium]